LDQNDLIAKLRAFFYALRHGQLEWILATLALGLPAATAYLPQEWKQFHQAAHLAYGLSAASAIWLIYRLWKLATPPPEPAAGPVPSAIKGLLPFTVADGKLFAQLGRRMELQQLLGLAQNDRIAISAVRGESGAGKTSLLQAGLAYTLGQEQCVYWEAVPEKASDALLHAIRSQLPGMESLESLPEACPKRCVLILDQFEQLRPGEPTHAPIFDLLQRIAKGPAPRKLSAVVGFRREYAANWQDLEEAYGFHAAQVPIYLLPPRTAGDALVTLASEAGFTLDQALVENFVSSVAHSQGALHIVTNVTRSGGVLPIDIAIGVLSLSNFVRQSGTAHVGMKEYGLAGGAEGLLLSFVQQELEEIPEAMRAPLLKGIVLALVNASDNQRIAEGETVAAIASKAEVAERALVPSLERLSRPWVGLLEKVKGDRYRLPHERLVPVLRRLAGATLASLDQLRLLFEGEYMRWRETRNRRYLLSGKDLRNVLRRRSQFVDSQTVAGKSEYLAACLRRRVIVRLAASAAVVAAAVAGYAVYRTVDGSIQRQKLAGWRLPREVFEVQDAVDQIDFSNHQVNDLTWLRSPRIKNLGLLFDGSRLAGLEKLTGLTSLSLDWLGPVTSLAGLEQLKGLTSLSLDLGNSKLTSLAGLEKLTRLTRLSLGLGNSPVTSLAGLEQLKGLTSLSLDLSNSKVTSLAGLEKLSGLTTLLLRLRHSPGTSLTELEQLKGLTSLSLDLSYSPVTSLAELEKLEGLTSLSLNLTNSPVTSLAGLEKLKGLTSLSLNLESARITSLAELEQLSELTTLSLRLRYSPVTSLAGLEKLKGLTSLSLDLGNSKVTSLAGLEKLMRLTRLSLNVANSPVTSLAELEQLKGLTSLSLDLSYSPVTSLAELEKLEGLTSLSLNLESSRITSLAELEHLEGLTSLTLDLRSSSGVTSLAGAGLEQLKGLTSLTLDLGDSKITSLTGLEQLKGLTSMEITLSASLVSNFSRLKIRRDITQLQILIDASTALNVPTGLKFVSITDD
jgi:hypothetical protein